MKGKFVLVLSVLLVLSILLTGCGGDKIQNGNSLEEEAVCTFTDDSGNKTTLYRRPENVAVLLSSYAQIWTLSGGVVSITVGDSVKRGFADKDVPLVDDGTGQNIDTERLVSLRPDFVIASADTPAQTEACVRLRGMGIPCGVFREETFSDYLNMLRLFAEINGEQTRYEQYGTALQEQIESTVLWAEEAVKQLEEPLSVLFIRAGSGGSSTRAKTAENHFVGIMLSELGTLNIADEAKELSEALSLEHILVRQPDVILIVAQGDEEAAQAYMNSVLGQSGWRELNAVRSGKVYYLPKEMFHYKPNALWADAYEYLASLLYGGGKEK